MAFFLCAETRRIVELNLDFDKSGDEAKDGGVEINIQWKNTPSANETGILVEAALTQSEEASLARRRKSKALVAEKLRAS